MKSFYHYYIFTNEDERYSDDEGQEVSSDWLVVFPVTFGEELEGLVDVVFAQSLSQMKVGKDRFTIKIQIRQEERLILTKNYYDKDIVLNVKE